MIILTRKFIDHEQVLPCSGVGGYFTIQKFKHGQLIQQVGPFKNMVVNNGLNRLGSIQVSNVYNAVHVGTGTTPPSPTDTSLANYVAGQNMGTGTFSYGGEEDGYFASRNTTATFAVGAVVGNITEVGIAGTSANSNLFARSLIMDSDGNPIAITVLADEQLVVHYQLRHYPPLVDALAEVTIGPNTHITTTRAIQVASQSWAFPNPSGTNQAYVNEGNTNAARWYNGDLAPITASTPSGSSKTISGLGTAEYIPNSYYRDLSSSSNPANGTVNHNVVHIRSNCSAFQVKYDPPLVKTADQTLVTWTRFSWGRYTP